MRILNDIQSFHPDPFHPLILGIGNFDGLHLGHQALLQSVIGKARRVKGTAGVLTFREHPQRVLHPEAKPLLLMSEDYKLFLLQEYGIDVCFWLSFTEAFSKIEPETFVKEFLVRQLQVKEVCLGYNARFGHDRRGDARLMQELARLHHFGFELIEPVRVGGDFVSSSRIRNLVKAGNLEEAEACLGHPFSIFGRVISGTGRGKSLGFPTANLEVESTAMPPEGVYPVSLGVLFLEREMSQDKTFERLLVRKRGPWLHGVLNYGTRPTFEATGFPGAAVPEVFILDFESNLYGQTLEIIFHPRLRPEHPFESVEALKKQIEEDIAKARRYFHSLPKKTFTTIAD